MPDDVKGRMRGLFYWLARLCKDNGSLTRSDTRGLNVAELVADQNTNEQQDGKPNPQTQGFDHVAGFGLTVAPIAHHENQSRHQTG